GITAGELALALRTSFAGIEAGDWIDPSGETRDVRVRLAPRQRTVAADIEVLPLVVQQPDGSTTVVPVGQVADVQQGLGPAQISHLDRSRVITIGANTEQRPLNQ